MLDFLLNIDWRQPLWFLLVLFPVVVWLALAWQKQQQQNRFADKHLLPWLEVPTEKTPLNLLFSRNTAYFLAWFLFSLALAGPRVPDKQAKQQNKILMDIMLVVDLSQSMQANDIKPTRIRRATLEIFDLLSIVKNARLGVIVYAGRAHLYVPLTSDLKALTFYLNDLDTLQLPTRGGDARSALILAQKELLAATQDNQQFIIWMTDGDLHGGNSDGSGDSGDDEKNTNNSNVSNNTELESELMAISKNNIETYILALGTEEGAAIPLPNGGWLESEGRAVISKMDQSLLKRLSKIGSKNQADTQKFKKVSNDNSDWTTLYSQGILKALANNHSKNTHQWKELYHWLLFPAILLLIMALFPTSLLRLFNKRSSNSVLQITLALHYIIFLFAMINPPLMAQELTDDKSYNLNINRGIEAYRQNDLLKAKRYFIASVLSSNNNKTRAIALHNLGNTLFQLSDYATAAELFTDALRYAPDQKQTATNQALSVELFIELEKRLKRKMNRGNFAAADDITPLFDLPEQLPFMLSTKAIMLLKVSLPKLPKEELDRLLNNKLLKFDLLNNEDKSPQSEAQKRHSQQRQLDMQQARLYLMDQEEQSSTATNPLWKRIFEIEEGFPGKLKESKTIPGVRPW